MSFARIYGIQSAKKAQDLENLIRQAYRNWAVIWKGEKVFPCVALLLVESLRAEVSLTTLPRPLLRDTFIWAEQVGLLSLDPVPLEFDNETTLPSPIFARGLLEQRNQSLPDPNPHRAGGGPGDSRGPEGSPRAVQNPNPSPPGGDPQAGPASGER